MQNICVMSHASDIDGVGSAALIRRKYGVPLNRLFFADYSKESLEYVNSKLKPLYKSGISLFITDLGVNDRLIDPYKKILKEVKSNGGRVIWFDHHPWTKRAVKELASMCDVAIIGENDDFCATEITFKELAFKDGFTTKFARIVHYSDFNITPRDRRDYETVGIYALSITSYGIIPSRDIMTAKLRHIAEVISAGKLYDARTRNDALRFKRLNDSRIARMIKTMILTKDAAVGFSEHVQSTAGCVALMKASRKPIGIYINAANRRGHLRCEDDDISGLARALGGGGHPHASGFNVDRKFGPLNTVAKRKAYADFLQSQIDEFV